MVCPKVPVYVRRSQFRLPNRPQTPVIMIGPGTGLAPFRGFIQERAWQKSQGKPVGPTVLYFGCRNKGHDYIYQEELGRSPRENLLDPLCSTLDVGTRVMTTFTKRSLAEVPGKTCWTHCALLWM